MRDNHKIYEELVIANGFLLRGVSPHPHTDKVPRFMLLKWELLRDRAKEKERKFCKQLEIWKIKKKFKCSNFKVRN